MTKNILLLSVLFLLAAGCGKDDTAPIITSFMVNGVNVSTSSGDHAEGSTINFEITVGDDTELREYQVKNESDGSALIAEGDLTGKTDTFAVSFTLDASQTAGQSILLTFIIEDTRGSTVIRQYTINVV